MTQPKIRITGEWKNSPLHLDGGLELVKIYADGGKQHGPVNMIYERDARRGRYYFRGIERVIDNPKSEFAGDLPPLIQSIGWENVPEATWKRVYKTDKQRRDSWDRIS
jgi:hypothetical protein